MRRGFKAFRAHHFSLRVAREKEVEYLLCSVPQYQVLAEIHGDPSKAQQAVAQPGSRLASNLLSRWSDQHPISPRAATQHPCAHESCVFQFTMIDVTFVTKTKDGTEVRQSKKVPRSMKLKNVKVGPGCLCFRKSDSSHTSCCFVQPYLDALRENVPERHLCSRCW